MTLGPIDFIALEFPGNRFKGEILPDLLDLVEREVIRIFDLVIVTKDVDGTVHVRELQELDPGEMSIVDPFKAGVSQMITELDIQAIAEKLDTNSTAGLMLIENLWAKKTQQAMLDANGKLVLFERIPHDVVEEALADIKALATA
ncbi:MAG: DUF6325 family protein [Nitrososphaerales archaeon]